MDDAKSSPIAVDAFLESLREEGELQSSGGFTCETAVTDADLAALLILRAAVVSGAAWFHAEAGAKKVALEFPGALAKSADFEALLRGNGLLARGMRTAGVEVEFTSWDGQQAARARVQGEAITRFQLSKEPPWTEPRTRVRWNRGPFEPTFLDRDILVSRGVYAPLKLRLNQVYLPAPALGGSPQLHINGCGCGIQVEAPKNCRLFKEEAPGKLLGALSARKGELRWIHQGVLLEAPRPTLPEGSAVLSTSLRIDIPAALERLLGRRFL